MINMHMHIVQACAQLHKQTNNGVCNHLYVGLLFDSIAFLKKVDVVKTCTCAYKVTTQVILVVVIDTAHVSILVFLCIGVSLTRLASYHSPQH